MDLVDGAGDRAWGILEQNGNSAAMMRPLYDAHIVDLGPDDFLRVECIACGHDELIPRIGLVVGLRLPAKSHSMLPLISSSWSCCRKPPRSSAGSTRLF